MRSALVLFAASMLIAACKKEQPAPPPLVPPSSATPAMPAAAGGLKGKVLETMASGGYTYLKLSTAEGESWAAVPQSNVAVGAEVVVANPMPMDGFESKTLNRRFDRISFGTAVSTASGTPAEAPGAAAGAPAHPPAQAAADLAEVKVEKAQGPEGRTVAEVFSQKQSLKDSKVAVKGKVVKVSSGILGKNWVHLRDGSGTADQQDNDLTITTQDVAAVGEVVVAKGVVHLDRDFGAGYSYPVIVEEATLAK